MEGMMKLVRSFGGMTEAEAVAHEARRREEEAQYHREVAKADAAAEARRIKALAIPDLALRDARGDLAETASMEALQAVSGFVVLVGGVGCGKTVAAASWLLSRKVGLWVSATRLARWPRYDDAEVRKLTMARALVIDDLGREFLDEKGSFLALFDEIVDERHQGQLSTVATANMTVEEFRERYGERTASRIRQAGALVNVDGPDLRGRR